MTETNLPVPTSEDEITKEWLQAVLASTFPNATFVSLERKRIGEGYGLASHIIRCQWEDHGTPRSVVVKLWDIDSGAGIEEVRFYQTFREVGARFPICFYRAVNKVTKRAVLVLEDIRDAVQGDVLEQLDLDRSKAVARSLARLHASWLEHPRLTELTWIPNITTWKRESQWFHDRRALFLERFPDHLDGLAPLLLDKIELAPGQANERLKNAPLSLLHGDFHLDNLLFENQTEPVFLDWSRPVKGAPAFNLVTLLVFMISPENIDVVFETYLEEFAQFSNRSQTRIGLERQLGGEFLRAFATSTCGIAKWHPKSEREIRMIETCITQVNNAVDFWQRRDPQLFSFLY